MVGQKSVGLPSHALFFTPNTLPFPPSEGTCSCPPGTANVNCLPLRHKRRRTPDAGRDCKCKRKKNGYPKRVTVVVFSRVYLRAFRVCVCCLLRERVTPCRVTARSVGTSSKMPELSRNTFRTQKALVLSDVATTC